MPRAIIQTSRAFSTGFVRCLNPIKEGEAFLSGGFNYPEGFSILLVNAQGSAAQKPPLSMCQLRKFIEDFVNGHFAGA